MNAKDAIKKALNSTRETLAQYLTDLSDADLLVRPVPKANYIAWQLGHLISAEKHLASEVLPSAQFPELPAGFDAGYTKETSASDSPKPLLSKQEYLSLFKKMREATLAAVEKLSDSDLDKPNTGRFAKYAPTVGDMLVLVSNHVLMHAGQFTVVRRKLGKPVLF
jgi:uncharacterized damage-inducible protein DinB